MVDLATAGLALLFVGFGVVALAVMRDQKGGTAKGGGVVMIGPIPIIFGTDAKWASVAMALAIGLVLLALLTGLA